MITTRDGMRFQARFQSIRSIVTSIIIVLGLLSMAATLITGQVYHNLTLGSQLENIERQIHIESIKTRQRLKQFSLQLSTLIINSNEFKRAYKQSRPEETKAYLKQLSAIPFLQSGVLSIRYTYLYDKDHKLIYGLRYSKNIISNASAPVCGKVMSITKPTSYALANDIVYASCIYKKKPFLSARVPFTLHGKHGYLELVSDTSSNLSHIDQIMDFPVRLRLMDETVIFISDRWPDTYDRDSVASYPEKNNIGETVLYIDALHVDSNLEEALSYAQLLVITGAVFSILVAIFLSLYVLKKTVISPVNDVMASLRNVRDSRDNLGEQVKSRGAEEIMALMEDFNAMSSALNQLYNTLEKMTYTDSLTRLGNRKLFHEKFTQLYNGADDENTKFALLLIDLDKFKQVNDTYGHLIGDQLLVETSNRFVEVMRQSEYPTRSANEIIASPVQDLLARLGGDEFAILLPGVNGAEDAEALASLLARAIQQPMVLDGQEIDFGLSIGIAVFPQHAKNIEELIRCADVAMYESKKENIDYIVYSDKLESLE